MAYQKQQFSDDMEFAGGGTVVVTLEIEGWHVGGCELRKKYSQVIPLP